MTDLAMNALAISTQGLSKNFGKIRAVDGLNLSVPRGAVYGFLGRNGAGKTTTIKSLLGLVRPSGGSATVLGYRVGVDTIAILQRTGFAGDSKALYAGLTPAQLVRFNRGFFPQWSDSLAQRYARIFEIPMDQRFGKLSLGNKSKVWLLLALAQGAELIVLDEPTAGLDPVIIDVLMRVLVEDHVSEGRTVFFSSHHLSEVERISDWIGIIDQGRLLLEARIEDMRNDFRLITASGDGQKVSSSDNRNIVSTARSDKFCRYLVSRDAESFAADLRQRGLTVLEVAPVRLEDVFLGLVRKDDAFGIPERPGAVPVSV